MPIEPLTGGCFCEGVRYALREPALSVQHCHCETCRKVTGSLSTQGAVFRRTALRLDHSATLKSINTSPSFRRDFCGACGCHLFSYERDEPDLMYVQVATLDGGVHPGHPADRESHIYVRSAAVWERIGNDHPQFHTTSPDEIITEVQRQDALNRAP